MSIRYCISALIVLAAVALIAYAMFGGPRE
jgi:hypothetical protein